MGLLDLSLLLREILERLSLLLNVLRVLPVVPITRVLLTRFFCIATLCLSLLISVLSSLFALLVSVLALKLCINDFLSFFACKVSTELCLFNLNSKVNSLRIKVPINSIIISLMVLFHVLLGLFGL